MEFPFTLDLLQNFPNATLDVDTVPPWVGHHVQVAQRKHYYRHRDFKLVLQDVDASRVYGCSLEINCFTETAIPFHCSRHDLYVLCQVEGSSIIKSQKNRTLIALDENHYQLPYAPPGSYQLHVKRGYSMLFLFVIKASWLKRYKRNTLKRLEKPLQHLLAKRAGCEPGKSHPLHLAMKTEILQFLLLPKLAGLKLDIEVENPIVNLVELHVDARKEQVEEADDRLLLINSICQYLDKEALSPLWSTSGELEKKFGYSQQYLNRLMHKYRDTTMHDYLHEKKLTEAKRLLSAGEKPTQVAYQLGFNSATALSKQFKLMFGIRPSDVQQDEFQNRQNEGS